MPDFRVKDRFLSPISVPLSIDTVNLEGFWFLPRRPRLIIMLILNQMGKIANLANTHGIQKLDEALMMRAIRENLDIPHRTIRRPHYKPPRNPSRSAMDELSDNMKFTLPQQFHDIPNHVVNSLVKLVIRSDESDALVRARKTQKGLRTTLPASPAPLASSTPLGLLSEVSRGHELMCSLCRRKSLAAGSLCACDAF